MNPWKKMEESSDFSPIKYDSNTEEILSRHASLIRSEKELDCEISTIEHVLKEVHELLKQG